LPGLDLKKDAKVNQKNIMGNIMAAPKASPAKMQALSPMLKNNTS